MARWKRLLKTWTSLFCVTAVCILLNLLGSKLNGALGLPLYLDNIGTILAALLGGYIPCITVGFMSNLIGGLSDSVTMYYCIISVFIAAFAAYFSDSGWLKKFPKVLVPVLVFALQGGIAGGALTWLIYGFSFGEGFAADFAAQINRVIPMGEFASNMLSNFLLDVADKAITVAVSLLLFCLIPKRLKAFLSGCSWYNLSVLEKKRKGTRRGMSLRLKLTLLLAVSTTTVAATAIGVSFMQYHNAAVEAYTETGEYATKVISQNIDKTKIDEYLEKGRAAEGYIQTEKMLYAISDSSSGIRFIYLYRIEADGTHVVFDLDTEDVKSAQPGDVIAYDKTITKYQKQLLAGEEIPPDISSDIYGWVLSVYRPIRDDSGKTLCYVGVDMSMDRLRSVEYAFLAKIFSLFIGFLVVIRTYAVWMAERKIVRPINSIADAALRVNYTTPQTREESMAMLEGLDIHTGDEIEHLYEAYKRASADTVRYIGEVQRKTEQITRLQNGLVLVLADMVESRDQCTGDHVRKTAAYAGIILRQMKKEGIYADRLTDEYIAEVVSSAPLHDVGKIAVSDTILNKPGKLTEEEFKTMQSHTTEGGKVIEKAMALVAEESEYLTEAKNLATGHHEKWNGKGYPLGLKGEEIPLSARVMAVADVFDALVSRRSYKEPFSIDKAIEIICHDAGSHFDPNVVRAFLDAEEEIRRTAELNMDI